MLVRVLEGNSWSTAEPVGDFEFEQIPQIGHKLALSGQDGWTSGQVRDIAHRIGDPDEAADVAILVGTMLTGYDRSDMLPLGQLDQLGGQTATSTTTTTTGTASVPRSSPWGS